MAKTRADNDARPLRFREFLWLQHKEETKYRDFAKFVLSGGPGGIWAGKPLMAKAVLTDIEGYYASGLEGITETHLTQARAAVTDYLEDPPLVDDLVESRLAGNKTISPVRAALEGTNSSFMYETQGGKTVGGTLVPIIKCGWKKEFSRVDDDGFKRTVVKRCTIDSVPGLDRCEIHGGSLVDESELQNHLRIAAIRLVQHSHEAVDTLVNLMNHSVDDSVRLRASEALLDRAGFKPGVDVHLHTDASGTIYDPTQSSAAAEIRERLLALVAPKPEPEPHDYIEGTVEEAHTDQPVYLLVGVPSSGTSWVGEQLTDKYEYVRHDDFIGQDYIAGIEEASRTATKPLLIETPFSMSKIVEPLEERGFDLRYVFILEDETVLRERYMAREKKEIPKGHLTRQQTYADRAEETGAFAGTSSEVLSHLLRSN
jgi:hypothetical protein